MEEFVNEFNLGNRIPKEQKVIEIRNLIEEFRNRIV